MSGGVAILAVGDELLLGDVANSNASWLGQQLTAAGVRVVASAVVGDQVERIVGALRPLLADAGVHAVVLTGGLGPTPDDLTREALAELAGVQLHRDPAIERALRDRYANLGRTPPQMNYRQADVPAGATVLPNPVGTAPGLQLEVGDATIYALPGVPSEMTAIVSQIVLPDLLSRLPADVCVLSRTLRVAGRWESEVAAAVEGTAADDLAVAFLAGGGEVRVRLTATAASAEQAAGRLAAAERQVRGVLGLDVFGFGGDSLPAVVHALLLERGATVAAAESLTGGLLGGMLSETAGSSATFRGGIVAYATELKTTLLGVPAALIADRGPVDGDVAVAMARGVVSRLGSTFGVALTGVAGPEPQAGAEPGTVYVGLAGQSGDRHRLLRLPGTREGVRRLAAMGALDALRRMLLREASQ